MMHHAMHHDWTLRFERQQSPQMRSAPWESRAKPFRPLWHDMAAYFVLMIAVIWLMVTL